MADQEIYDTEEDEGVGQPFSLDLPVISDIRGRDPNADYSLYTEGVGAVSYKKVLTPKSKTFDALTRARTEDQESVPVVVSQPFRQEMAEESIYSYPQIFKEVFHKEPELESEDKMMSSTVIGWTTETNRVLLINASHLGDLSQDIVPMTDSIFPVFVCGHNHNPVTPQVLERDITAFEAGGYLVLSDCPGLGSITVEISSYKHRSLWKFSVNTYRAELELFYVQLRWDETDQTYYRGLKRFGKIDRIVDKDNAAYGVFGMYAGGPLPPESNSRGKHRICWDQPRSDRSNDYGFKSMEGGFRCDIDYQRGSRRVGFFCSRDALLTVRETKILEVQNYGTPRSSAYKSLLKDSTYVIVDGFSTYSLFYGESQTQNIPFKDLDDTTLGPIIVIVPEGVSSLEVIENREFRNYRNSMYYNENPTQPPLVINWKTFQRDFNLDESTERQLSSYMGPQRDAYRRSPERQSQKPIILQQIMKIEDFQDYVVFPVSSIFRELVFCLKQAPNYFPAQKRYDEYWHVYGRLSSGAMSDRSSLYYYLGTISNSYHPRYGILEYSKTYFQHSFFPTDINKAKYPNITQQESERALEMAEEWKWVTKNVEFKTILRALVTLNIDRLRNVTINAYSRQKRIDSLSVNVP